MQEPDPRRETLKLIERMAGPALSHHRFAGEPIDMTQIDALALGDLWTVVHSTKLWDHRHRPIDSLAADTARAVLAHAGDVGPAFRGPACRDYIDCLAEDVEATPPDAADFRKTAPWEQAAFTLERCIDLSFEGVGVAARRFLAAADWRIGRHHALVLARLVDPSYEMLALERLTAEISTAPLVVAEIAPSPR